MFMIFLLIGSLIAPSSLLSENDLASSEDYQIARAVRRAVRAADASLLHSSVLADWRDYLKLAGHQLDPELQPLLLIKFDQDSQFRHQLKTVIAWERDWRKKATAHYIYYFREEFSPPEILLGILDGHFKELTRTFELQIAEKIPYRYDLDAGEGNVFPFEDLRAGIVSANPFDFEKAALAVFYSLNARVPFFLRPLCRIYGTFYQNDAAARAYYDSCTREIGQQGYVSAGELYPVTGEKISGANLCSAYVFVYDLLKEFGPLRLKQFMVGTEPAMQRAAFAAWFEETFQISLTDFEAHYRKKQALNR